MISAARRTVPTLVLTLGLAASAAAQEVRGLGAERAPSADSAAPGSVLLIDGEAIPGEDFAAWLIEEVGPPLMKEFAVGWEIGRLAEERGLAADDEQIRARLDEEIAIRVKGAFRGEIDGWVDELARTYRSVDGYRVQRTAELEAWLDAFNMANDGRVVPEHKIERDWNLYYGPRGRAFDLDMLKVEIVMQMPEEKGRELVVAAREAARAKGLDEINRLREQLLAGADFALLAREHSDDAETREAGGHVPRFVQFGWPENFVTGLFDLEKGELSEPMFARGGWWIVHVRDWIDTPLESVRAELTQRLEEKGPEQDEVGNVWDQVSSEIDIQIEPGMYSADVPTDGERPEVVAMTVNGRPVPRKVVARWLLHSRGEHAWPQYTEEWLLMRKARELGIELDEAELEGRVQEYFDKVVSESFKGDRGLWRSHTESAGTDPDAWMRQFRRRRRVELLAEKVMLAERVVTPEEVRLAYTNRYGETGRRVQARVLLLEVPTPPMEKGITKEETDRRLAAALEARWRDAEKLRKRAQAGEDFATLVRQFSDDAISRERDGVLEGGFRPDGWSSNVSEEVMAVPRGGISAVVQEGRFLAVFEILDFEEVPFEAVRAEIEQELRERRPASVEIAAFRNVLLKGAKVEVLPDIRR